MIKIIQLSKYFDLHCVFADVNQTIPESRVVISGPNGCGKTTLLLLMAGILPADNGQILLNDRDVSLAITQQQIGISSAKIQLPDFLSARQLLEFHCHQQRSPWPEALIEEFRFSPFLATRVGDLSLGNEKKLSLLTALLHQPELLLLDEPGNGLDDHGLATLQRLLNDYTGQVIVASHEQQIISAPERHIELQRPA